MIDTQTPATTPNVVPVVATGIPQELTELRQWLSWDYETRNGKPTKVPINSRTGGRAQSTNSGTWSTFGEAFADYRRGRAGVGFVFAASDPYCGVDLDACHDPATGQLTPWAQRIVTMLDSYCEISPSGYGVKLTIRAKLPSGHNVKKLTNVPTYGCKAPEIALYDKGRFWCMTGQRFEGAPAEIRNGQAEREAPSHG